MSKSHKVVVYASKGYSGQIVKQHDHNSVKLMNEIRKESHKSTLNLLSLGSKITTKK